MMRNFIKRLYQKLKESPYIKFGLLFAFLFLFSSIFIYFLEYQRNPDDFTSFSDAIWFTFITASTTGYGDKVPLSPGGRFTALMVILIGVGAVGILSGAFASIFVDRNSRARRGLMDFPKMKNHFIICGWKNHMQDILEDILRVSGDIEAKDIIIISNVGPEKIQEIQNNQELSGVKYVKGEYFSESALIRANAKMAKKILILADTFESEGSSEVDSKTVMAVLTAKAISKDLYTCAELLDRKYESYLKHALCDEILFSRDFSRKMLASTTATNGMSHIVLDILSYEHGTSFLSTEQITNEYIGQTYGDFRKNFRSDGSKILLGLLENTGSPNQVKMEALRDAQKTSDISRLVSNLQRVKDIEVNTPVLIPADDYLIQRYSRAIVLQKRS